MKFKDFVDRVNLIYNHLPDYRKEENLNVVIGVVRVGSVGGTPSVELKSIQSGFDWDSGKIILTPEVDLREIGRDEIKSLQVKYEVLSWKEYKVSNLRRENKKLKERIAELEKNNENDKNSRI